MVKIFRKQVFDVEFHKIEKAIEKEASRQPERLYLGMSEIGDSCERKLWASFRCVTKDLTPSWLADAAYCGHMAEDVMIDRIKKIDGIEFITEGFGSDLDQKDRSSGQLEFSDFNGHFKGHPDGLIKNISDAPKTWHVWEHKDKGMTSSRSKDLFQSLVDISNKFGTKEALKLWDYKYYIQAQMYMHYSGYKRHILTCSHGISRRFFAVRTDYNKEEAVRHVSKAKRIISSNVAPVPRYDQSKSHICKYMCAKKDWCTGKVEPVKSCRTCLHGRPIERGGWGCVKLNWLVGGAEDQKAMTPCQGQDWQKYAEPVLREG